MNINTVFLKNLDWWRTELSGNPQNHIESACITAATTLLVAALWNRYQALGFACLAIASYPMTHHQIKFLMCVDLHETIYAAAIVGIQFFSRQFPQFSALALPMSVALAYAFTVRGMNLRHSLEEQRAEIQIVSSLNTKLAQEIELLSNQVNQLKKDLEIQATLVQEKQQLENKEQEIQDKKTNILSGFNTRLESLLNECQQFQGKDLKILVQNDNNKQIVAKLGMLMNAVNQLSQKISGDNKEESRFIQNTLANEQEFQNSLILLHQKLLSSIA